MYSGMVDDNLARTQHHPRDEASPFLPPPDLVDFQLLKIHLLTVDCSDNNYFDVSAPDLRDKFISQTLAYGKLGQWNRPQRETQGMSC